MKTVVLISKYLMLLHVIVVKTYGSNNVITANEQQKYRNFVVGGNQLISMVVVSLGMCSYHCLWSRDCVSFFFNKERRVCKLHSVLFPASAFWVPDKAWVYYQVNGGVCDPLSGYIHQRHLSLCYKLHTGTNIKSVSEAALVCQKEDAELTRVDSDNKQRHLAQYLDMFREEKTYIQGSDVTQKGTWRFNDGEKMIYFHWSSRSNQNVHDVHVLNYLVMSRQARFGWERVSGNESFAFICEKRPI